MRTVYALPGMTSGSQEASLWKLLSRGQNGAVVKSPALTQVGPGVIPASCRLSSYSFSSPSTQPQLFLSVVPVSYLKSDSQPGRGGCRVSSRVECPSARVPPTGVAPAHIPGAESTWAESDPGFLRDKVVLLPSLSSGCLASSYGQEDGEDSAQGLKLPRR